MVHTGGGSGLLLVPVVVEERGESTSCGIWMLVTAVGFGVTGAVAWDGVVFVRRRRLVL